MTAGVRDERGEEQNREEGENEMWEKGDIDEKVILWFFNFRDDTAIPLGLLGLP